MAITVADNTTAARVGSGAGLNLSNNFSATSSNTASSTTTAESTRGGG